MPVIDLAQAADTVQGLAGGVSLRAMMAFAAAWTALLGATLFWAVKWLLAQHQAAIGVQFTAVNERFDTLAAKLEKDQEALLKLERDFMALKADLPIAYVRKEDAVRHEAVFNAKLDALASKIDNLRKE